MPKVIRCPSCQSRYQIADAMMGRKFKCSKCGQALQLGPATATQPSQARAATSAEVGQVRTTQPAIAMSNSLSSLLDEELAIEAAKAQAAAQAARDAELDAEFGEDKPAEAPKVKCPHCDYEIGAEELYCPACGLTVQTRLDKSKSGAKSETKDLLISIAAVVLSLVMSPLLFLGVQMVLGTFAAIFVTALAIRVLVSIGSFSVACRLFRQEPPDVGEIFRVLCWGWLPNMVLDWVGGTGLGSMLVSVTASILISAVLCTLILDIHFLKAIGICITYNILAFVLALVAVLLLVAVFITTAPMPDLPAAAPMPGEPAGAPDAPPGEPGAPPAENAEGAPGQPQARVGTTVEPALVLRWLEICHPTV